MQREVIDFRNPSWGSVEWLWCSLNMQYQVLSGWGFTCHLYPYTAHPPTSCPNKMANFKHFTLLPLYFVCHIVMCFGFSFGIGMFKSPVCEWCYKLCTPSFWKFLPFFLGKGREKKLTDQNLWMSRKPRQNSYSKSVFVSNWSTIKSFPQTIPSVWI